jgi:glycosyltransferase involved in cell wall biosynthesis
VNYFTYLGRALRRGLQAERPDVVLCMTDPPLVGDVALIAARRFRVPLIVISQDVFPEIAVQLNRLTSPLLVRLLDVLTRFYLRRAQRVVAIGPTMERRLEAKGVDRRRLRVIPNWTDPEAIVPAPRDNEWAREQELVGRFVVMHSGNIGHAQDLETLIRAVGKLDDLKQLAVVLVGFGARHAYYESLRDRLALDAVRFSADVHFVGLAHGLAGYVVPSRLYGIMAAGRPVLVSADDESETAQLVRDVGCGLVVPPGQPERVAAAIRSLAAGEHDLDELGRRGRLYVENEAGRQTAMARYRALLAELV